MTNETMSKATRLFLQLLLAALTGAAIFAAGGYYLYPYLYAYLPPPAAAQSRSHGQVLSGLKRFGELRTTDTPTPISALGRLQPRGAVTDIAGLVGDRLGSLEVKEGDQVKEGKVLGYLESHAEAEAQWDTAAAQLAEANARLKAETAYSKAKVEEARIAVRQARDLEPLDIQAQKDRVDLLQIALETEQAGLKRLQNAGPGAVPAQKLDQQRLLVSRDLQELREAKTILEKMQTGAGLKSEAALAQLHAAEAELNRVEASASIQSLTRSLALAKARLDRTVLKAPCDGRILKVLTRPGASADHQPILKMGDTQHMYVVAEVYETDIHGVQVGQQATVTSLALSQPLKGTVERIGQMVFKNDVLSVDPAADADARVVDVWIALLNPPETVAGLTNLQVDVKIHRTAAAGTTLADESPQPGK